MRNNSFVDSFSAVAQLQKKLFPSKVLSFGPLHCRKYKNETIVSENLSEEGYKCHRSHPLQPFNSLSPMSALYNVVREACAQQNIKWPVECQVLPDPVHHIEDWPLYPEAFYQPSGRELRPQPVGDDMGRIVYQYYPTSTVNYFTRSCLGGNKQINSDVRPVLNGEEDSTLQFESRFESANLAKCVQISECYYELHLRSDLYTARHTQWYYFSVSNMRKDVTYRFSIVNLNKGDSLYNHGMKPLMYSTKEAELHNVGWRRCGSNITYFRNQDCEGACYDSDDEGEEETPSYTLTFNISFPHDKDTVFLAHCFPYTYSLLQHHLLGIQNDQYRSSVCRQRVLCRSLAGNPVYILTITSQEPEDENRKKRAVVLTARVHPGETPSSWIMKGAIDFLTSDHPKAIELRKLFVFKVIPMVNPDGVIVGNHRCSLSGRDLNRQYKMVVKEMFPAVWHAKAMVRRLMDEHGVMMFCDFHAHSRKHNIFLYGCENRRNNENHLREQIFPLLLYYNAGDKFSFRNCKFRVQRCKEGTARVVVWMMGILHSYTLESSFGGASEGPRAGTHYSILDFLAMGRQFCESLGEYFDSQPGKNKRKKFEIGSGLDLSKRVRTRMNQLQLTLVLMKFKFNSCSDSSSSGDSDRGAPPPRVRRKRAPRQQKKRGGKLGDKNQSRNSSIDLNDDTSTYVERVGELMSTRLAVSDNEGELSVSYWELQSPSTQWEKVSNSGSTLNRYESHRSYFHRPARFDALEPVIAKTRLHEPRALTRSPKTSPTRYSTSKLVRNHLQSSKLRFGEKESSTLKKKRGILKKTLSERDSEELVVNNRLRRNSICIDVVRSNEIKLSESIIQRSKTPPPKESSIIIAPEFPINSDVPTKQNDSNTFQKSNSSSSLTEKSKPLDIDEERLCADIAGCDTLFMDIGAKETPQLKAARNLKGRLIRKKAQLNEIADSKSSSIEDSQDHNGNESLAQNINGVASTDNATISTTTATNNSTHNETKTKKKIKIVIGKRPKPRINRKKIIPDLD